MKNNYECIIYLDNLFEKHSQNVIKDNKLSAQDYVDIKNVLDILLNFLSP